MNTRSPYPHHDSAADCDGLADGWARRLASGEPVHAAEATKAYGPFYCAACHEEVLLRDGAERARHFAHHADRQAAAAGEESALHRACKREVAEAVAAALPDGQWAIERTIPARPERGIAELRPDVSGRVRGVPVAIEVQASTLQIASILQRTRTYSQRGIHVLWIVPLREPPDAEGIRPRQYERYFHTMYLGRTYYWWPGLGASVLPMHYGTASRPVPRSQWFRRGHGPVEVGGHDAPYKSVRIPYCGPRVDIAEHFAPLRRGPFVPENARKAVPACHLWMDRLPAWW